jgi:hypothetical protein
MAKTIEEQTRCLSSELSTQFSTSVTTRLPSDFGRPNFRTIAGFEHSYVGSI